MSQLARDNDIGKSTCYDYPHEGIRVLAARAPSLHGALLAAKAAGYSHVSIHGTLIATDRVSGWPIWTSEVRPGREHDTTAVGTHTEILPTLIEAGADLRSLGDPGYEGEADTITVAFKKPENGTLTDLQQQFNKAHNGVRAIGERGNALLKMTFKALRNISLDPWCIGRVVAAALVLLHVDHARTT